MRTLLALLLLPFALDAAAQPRRPGAIPDCERVGRRLGLSPDEVARMCAGGRDLLPPPGAPLPPRPGEPRQDQPFSCTERCQRFDDWGKCLYRTRCEPKDSCMLETVCDRFDDWGECLSEASKLSCRTRGRRRAEAACEARCDRYDDWGKCLFQPTCSWDGACMSRTSCSRYDDWGKCLFEGVTTTCPAFGSSGRRVSCTESCQRFDDWGKCLYRTRCERDAECLRETVCERFDDWDACQSETTRLSCG